MKKLTLISLSLLVLAVFLVACGGGTAVKPIPTPVTQGSALSLLINDDPPAGVSVVSFQVTVTSAVLQPGNVQLITAPVSVELKRLEADASVLNTLNVPNGTYTSITLTVSNPQMTITNGTAQTLFGTCAPAQTCQVTPPLNNSGTVTFSGAPFPITVSGDLALKIDFDLKRSILQSLAITPTIGVTHIPGPRPTGEFEAMVMVGRVSAVNAAASTFDVAMFGGMRTITIKVDANTSFAEFSDVGLPNAFASLAAGQWVGVAIKLVPGGTLLAKKVELQDSGPDGDLEAVVVHVVNSTDFKAVVMEHTPNMMGSVGGMLGPLAIPTIGNPLIVRVRNGSTFRIGGDATVPTEFTFAGMSDLMAGQTVQIRPKIMFFNNDGSRLLETDRLILRESRVTGRVTVKGGTSLFIDQLSPLYTNQSPAITQIELLTSASTEFGGTATGMDSIAVGDTISGRGLLFKTAGTPVMLTKKVLKR